MAVTWLLLGLVVTCLAQGDYRPFASERGGNRGGRYPPQDTRRSDSKQDFDFGLTDYGPSAADFGPAVASRPQEDRYRPQRPDQGSRQSGYPPQRPDYRPPPREDAGRSRLGNSNRQPEFGRPRPNVPNQQPGYAPERPDYRRPPQEAARRPRLETSNQQPEFGRPRPNFPNQQPGLGSLRPSYQPEQRSYGERGRDGGYQPSQRDQPSYPQPQSQPPRPGRSGGDGFFSNGRGLGNSLFPTLGILSGVGTSGSPGKPQGAGERGQSPGAGGRRRPDLLNNSLYDKFSSRSPTRGVNGEEDLLQSLRPSASQLDSIADPPPPKPAFRRPDPEFDQYGNPSPYERNPYPPNPYDSKKGNERPPRQPSYSPGPRGSPGDQRNPYPNQPRNQFQSQAPNPSRNQAPNPYQNQAPNLYQNQAPNSYQNQAPNQYQNPAPKQNKPPIQLPSQGSNSKTPSFYPFPKVPGPFPTNDIFGGNTGLNLFASIPSKAKPNLGAGQYPPTKPQHLEGYPQQNQKYPQQPSNPPQQGQNSFTSSPVSSLYPSNLPIKPPNRFGVQNDNNKQNANQGYVPKGQGFPQGGQQYPPRANPPQAFPSPSGGYRGPQQAFNPNFPNQNPNSNPGKPQQALNGNYSPYQNSIAAKPQQTFNNNLPYQSPQKATGPTLPYQNPNPKNPQQAFNAFQKPYPGSPQKQPGYGGVPLASNNKPAAFPPKSSQQQQFPIQYPPQSQGSPGYPAPQRSPISYPPAPGFPGAPVAASNSGTTTFGGSRNNAYNSKNNYADSGASKNKNAYSTSDGDSTSNQGSYATRKQYNDANSAKQSYDKKNSGGSQKSYSNQRHNNVNYNSKPPSIGAVPVSYGPSELKSSASKGSNRGPPSIHAVPIKPEAKTPVTPKVAKAPAPKSSGTTAADKFGNLRPRKPTDVDFGLNDFVFKFPGYNRDRPSAGNLFQKTGFPSFTKTLSNELKDLF